MKETNEKSIEERLNLIELHLDIIKDKKIGIKLEDEEFENVVKYLLDNKYPINPAPFNILILYEYLADILEERGYKFNRIRIVRNKKTI